MPGRTERPEPGLSAGTPGAAADCAGEADLMVTVDSLNHEAQGVARHAGKVMFIDGALPGEQARVQLLKRRKSYDIARTVGILEASSDRVTPRCRYFGVCGGCSLQHLRTEAQPAIKERWLRDSLERIGRVSPARWLPAVTGPGWGYRRRARLGARFVPGKGGALVGFRERRRSYITPLESCEVLVPELAALLPGIRELVASLSRPDRLPQIELAAGDHAVALVFRHLEPLTEVDQARLRDFGRAHSVQIHGQAGGPESIRPLWPETLAALSYRLDDPPLEFRFSPTDFIQVNAEMNRKMVDAALALLTPRPDEQVLDLYCGLGNFSLPIARRAARVLGIEGDPGLVERAQTNAALNGIANAGFLASDLARSDSPDPWGPTRFDACLLDPPRTGALAVIQRFTAGTGPRRIVYVSCNPATLARDAGVLVSVKGYRLSAAGILDLFPQTGHVEAIALFETG